MTVRWTTKEIVQLSNVCYNRGLEKAQIRDMDGAIKELKRCLQLNKNHTNARNLLGLVYYEIGEMADALAEWVISTNFQARNNEAIQYINKLQERQEFLDEMIMASRKYNQALHLLRQNSEDLAILQLNKVLSLNPKFVRAYQLLALVYIKRCQYAKAEKNVKKALNLDRTNSVSLRYLNELKRIAYARKKRNLEDLSTEDTSRFDGLSADDVIIPTYHGDILGGWVTVVNLLVGIGIGLACFYFMILPARESALAATYNRQIVEINRDHSAQEAEVGGLKAQVEELQTSLENLTNTAAEDSARGQNLVSQYASLLTVVQKLASTVPEEYLEAVSTLQQMNVEGVTDETLLGVYNTLKAQAEVDAPAKLLEWGRTSYQSENYEAAQQYLTQCLNYKPDEAEAMFYLGVMYSNQNNIPEMVNWMSKIVNEFPGTEWAERAAPYL